MMRRNTIRAFRRGREEKREERREERRGIKDTEKRRTGETLEQKKGTKKEEEDEEEEKEGEEEHLLPPKAEMKQLAKGVEFGDDPKRGNKKAANKVGGEGDT